MRKNWKNKIVSMTLAAAVCGGMLFPGMNVKDSKRTVHAEENNVSSTLQSATEAASTNTTIQEAGTTSDATTQGIGTDSNTAASASTEQAVYLSASVGYSLMNGEKTEVTFDTYDTVYIPVTVSEKGYITVYCQDSSLEDDVAVSIVSKDTMKEVMEEETVSSNDNTGACAMDAGDYYLKLTGEAGKMVSISVGIDAGLVMNSGKTQSMALGSHSSSSKYYMQINANKTGLLKLENMTKSGVKVTLCNADKKGLSSKKSLSAYSSKNRKKGKNSTHFGVVKGSSYLLCFSTGKSVKKVSLKYTISSYSNVGGSSLTSAKTLVKRKKVKATLGAGSRPSYFKFAKSGYGQKTVTVKTMKNQGKLKVRLYYKEIKGSKKGKILPVKVKGKQIGWSQSSERINTLKIPGNWPKVTYYLKISNDTSKSSGSYEITVK